MVNDIIARLKKGSIPNVVPFANGMKVPPPPYVVVKPEAGAVPGTRQYRIIVHHNQGMFDVLEKYTLVELDSLLRNGVEDGKGGRYKLYANGYTDITAEPGGDTCFMERLYTVPLTIRRQ